MPPIDMSEPEILEAIRQCNYQRDRLRAALRIKQSETIVLSMPDRQIRLTINDYERSFVVFGD